jgi:putative spermidine/putrescine transport system permease protein
MSSETEREETQSTITDLFSGGNGLGLREAHLLSVPTVVWFFVFLIVPLFAVFVYGFMSYSNFNVVFEFTLDPWTETVFSDTVLRVFARTLVVGLGVTAITLVFGYPLAYFLRFYTGEIMGIILLLFLVIPFWTSELIRTLGWFPILGASGAINYTLISLGLTSQPIDWLLFTPFSQVLGYLQNFLVFMASPIYISLAQIDEDLLDASSTLRGGPIETFRNVTLPLSLPGVAIGCLFTFVLAVGNLTIPQFLSGGERTVTMLVYEEVQRGLHYPNAAAMSIALLVVIFGFVFALFRFVDITDIAQG